ncbi:MAG: hypothetical protein O6928_08660 [Gammaproteobacteria bacterium]|nr:hypothetical protein [Gammaproteobacteria bacterium]
MNNKHIDWSVMRTSSSILIISLLLGGLLIGSSFYFKEQMKKEYVRNNAGFQSISQRYLAVDEEEKLIKKYYPSFIKLYNQGVIGKEHRLNWIEVLRSAGEAIMLPSLSYEIKSQNIYTPAFSVNLGRYQIFSSEMSLDMQLLHEGDLFSLLKSLDENAKGHYSISRCSMDKRLSGIIDDISAANIGVKCDVIWFTIKLADGTELQV